VIVKVEEAKKMWCPMARDGHRISTPYGASGYSNNDNAKCRADKCMMWRWDGGLESGEFGYCGLAGQS
jgi:hypothetical protein